jgi:hypothetical protein
LQNEWILVIFALDLGNEIRDKVDTGYLGSAAKVLKCVSPYHTGAQVFFFSGPRGQKSVKVQAASIIFVTLLKTSVLAIQKLVLSANANYNAATYGSSVLYNWRLAVGHASSYSMC